LLNKKHFLLTAIGLFRSVKAGSLVNCIYLRIITSTKSGPPKSFLEFINIGGPKRELLFFSYSVKSINSNNFLQMSTRYVSSVVRMIIMYYCYVCWYKGERDIAEGIIVDSNRELVLPLTTSLEDLEINKLD
jgi:hypothetical protein